MATESIWETAEVYRLLREVQVKQGETLERILSQLNSKERFVIEMRSGLKGGVTYSWDVIALELGSNKTRVRGIEDRAVKKLRRVPRLQHLMSALLESTVIFENGEYQITVSGSEEFNVPSVLVITFIKKHGVVRITDGRDILIQTKDTETRIAILTPTEEV